MSNVAESVDAIIYVGLGVFILILVLSLSYGGYATNANQILTQYGSGSLILTVNPSGGTSPYTYQWYTGSTCTTIIGGQTGQTYTNTVVASYSALVTDSASNTVCAHN